MVRIQEMDEEPVLDMINDEEELERCRELAPLAGSSEQSMSVMLASAVQKDIGHHNKFSEELKFGLGFCFAMMNALPAHGSLEDGSDLQSKVNAFRKEIRGFSDMMNDFILEVTKTRKKFNVTCTLGRQVLENARVAISQAEKNGIPVDMDCQLSTLLELKGRMQTLSDERSALEEKYEHICKEGKLKAAWELGDILAGGEGTKAEIFQKMQQQLNTSSEFLMEKLSAESDKNMADEELAMFTAMKKRLDENVEKMSMEVGKMQDQINEISHAPTDAIKQKIEQFTDCMMSVRESQDKNNKAIQEQCAQERERLQEAEAEHVKMAMKGNPTNAQKKQSHLILMLDPQNLETHHADALEEALKTLRIKRSGDAKEGDELKDLITVVYFVKTKIVVQPTLKWSDFEKKIPEINQQVANQKSVNPPWERAWDKVLEVVQQVSDAVTKDDALHLNTVVLACVSDANIPKLSLLHDLWYDIFCKSQNTMKLLYEKGNSSESGPRANSFKLTTLAWMMINSEQDVPKKTMNKLEKWTSEANGSKSVWPAPDHTLKPFVYFGTKDSTLESIVDVIHGIASVGPTSDKDRMLQEMENRQQDLQRMEEISAKRCSVKMKALADISKKFNEIMVEQTASDTGDQGGNLQQLVDKHLSDATTIIDKQKEDLTKDQDEKSRLAEKIQKAKNTAELSRVRMEKAEAALQQSMKASLTESDWEMHNKRVAQNQEKLQGINAIEVNNMVQNFIHLRNQTVQNCQDVFQTIDMILTPVMQKIKDLERTAKRKLPDLGLPHHVLSHLTTVVKMNLDLKKGLFDVWCDIIELKTPYLNWGENKQKLREFASLLPLGMFLFNGDQLSDEEHTAEKRTKELTKDLMKKCKERRGSQDAKIKQMKDDLERWTGENEQFRRSLDEVVKDLKHAKEDHEQDKLEATKDALEIKIDQKKDQIEEKRTSLQEATNNLTDDIREKETVMFDSVPILVAFLRDVCSSCILTCTGKLWEKQVDQLVHIAGGDCMKVMSNLAKITEETTTMTVPDKDLLVRCSMAKVMDQSQALWFSQERPPKKRLALAAGNGDGSHSKRLKGSC